MQLLVYDVLLHHSHHRSKSQRAKVMLVDKQCVDGDASQVTIMAVVLALPRCYLLSWKSVCLCVCVCVCVYVCVCRQ